MASMLKRSGIAPPSPAVRPRPQTTARLLTLLSLLTAALGGLAAGAGLLSGGPAVATAATVRGQNVELYGRGIYRSDTLFTGALNRGTDLVTLVLAIPLLLIALLFYRRGSLRGALLLLGALSWFLYVGASYALGAVAYNDLFLVYVALLAASLWTFLLHVTSINLQMLRARLSSRAPRRGLAGFLFVSGVVTLGIWLLAPVTSLFSGKPPDHLDTYTTLFTTAFDVAIIVPAVLIAGLLVLRRAALGYLGAIALLVLEALLAPMIAAQTVSQLRAGVELSPGEIAGPVAGFFVVAVAAVWFCVAVLRAVGRPAEGRPIEAARVQFGRVARGKA